MQDTLSRRNFLAVSGVAALTTSLAQRIEQAIAQTRVATRERLPVLLLYLHGGASCKEMFDPDPMHTPSEYRGPLGTIQTNVPGMHFSEHWKNMSQYADRMAMVRNIVPGTTDHPEGVRNMLIGNSNASVGYRWGSEIAESGQPPYAIIYSPDSKGVLPREALAPNMALDFCWHEAEQHPVSFSLYQGAQVSARFEDLRGHYTSGISALTDEEKTSLHRRAELRSALPGNPVYSSNADRLESNHQLAISLYGGESNLSLAMHPDVGYSEQSASPDQRVEHTARHNAYKKRIEKLGGENPIAQQVLLAAQLIEEGTRVVAINHMHYDSGPKNWDDHNNIEMETARRAPPLDKALAGIMHEMVKGDIRPMLIAIVSEFDRTPLMNATAGRDHWDTGTLTLLAPEGHAICGGSTYGDKDFKGVINGRKLPAKDGAVVNTIIHAAANGRHGEFLTPGQLRAKEVMLHQ